MRKRLLWIIPAGIIVLLAVVFLCYTGRYYHADAKAAQALVSDSEVQVTETDYGWFFDGPSEDTGLVFYPGGKVERRRTRRCCICWPQKKWTLAS